MAEDGPIARIYSKVAESNSQDNRDVVAEFIPEDFRLILLFVTKFNTTEETKKLYVCLKSCIWSRRSLMLLLSI